GPVVLLEEQLAPRELQIRVVADEGRGVAEQRVRLLVPSEPPCGARAKPEQLAVAAARCSGHERLELRGGLAGPPEQQVQFPQRELRLAPRRGAGCRLE